MKKIKYLIVALLGLMISMSGSQVLALFNNYGTIVPSSDVLQAFDNNQIDPNLNYYFVGSELWPNAIIGVNNAYTLDSTSWKKIVATPEVFKKLISGMKSRPDTSSLYGFAILDNKGRQIGVWYSMMGVIGSVKMESERIVYISTPRHISRPEMEAP